MRQFSTNSIMKVVVPRCNTPTPESRLVSSVIDSPRPPNVSPTWRLSDRREITAEISTLDQISAEVPIGLID